MVRTSTSLQHELILRFTASLAHTPALRKLTSEPDRGPTYPKDPSFPNPSIKAFPLKASIAPLPKTLNEPYSSEYGKFTLSLRGIQRTLQRITLGSADSRASQIVMLVERELSDWLRYVGCGGPRALPADPRLLVRQGSNDFEAPLPVEFTPPASPPLSVSSSLADLTAVAVVDEEDELEQPAIIELNRSPAALIWRVDDPFTRFLVHCVSRLQSVVSFSEHILIR